MKVANLVLFLFLGVGLFADDFPPSHAVSVCLHGSDLKNDLILKECEADAKAMEACGITVHRVFTGPPEGAEAQKTFYEKLRASFPPGAVFFIDAHGDLNARPLISIPKDKGADGTDFYSGEGQLIANSGLVLEALAEKNGQAPVWVDSCRANGCPDRGSLRIGAACEFDEYSRMDAPYKKRLMKLLCDAHRRDCNEWTKTDTNFDGVIDAVELNASFCTVDTSESKVANFILKSSDPNYLARTDELKRQCKNLETKTGFRFVAEGEYRERDFLSGDTSTDRSLRTSAPVIPEIRMKSGTQKFLLGVFADEAEMRDQIKQHGWKEGQCHSRERLVLSEDEMLQRRLRLSDSQFRMRTGTSGSSPSSMLDDAHAMRMLDKCKISQESTDRVTLFRCERTIAVANNPEGECRQCPNLRRFALNGPVCPAQAQPPAIRSGRGQAKDNSGGKKHAPRAGGRYESK